jgi:hypothetical protein
MVRMQFRPSLVIVALVIAVSAITTSAFADSQSVTNCTNCNGYTFEATLNPVNGSLGLYSLSYTITNVSGAAANPYSWSLTLFNNGNSITGITDFSVTSSGNDYTLGYQVMAGKSNNGNGNCNGTLSDAMCVKQSSSGSNLTLTQGQSSTFTFDFTCSNCTELANWIFLSQGNCVTGSGNCYSPSTTGTPVSMPEPSIVILYGSTFAVLGISLFWRRRSRIGTTPMKVLGQLLR